MIDATFKNPTTNEFFAFSGSQFVRFAFANSRRGDKITNSGPVSINTNWKSLTKAGFSTVDAVLPVPRVKGNLYVFSGRQYIRIRVKSGDDLEDELIFGPHKILDTWKCLAQAGFDTVNAVMPVPDIEDEAYFFQGIRYVRVNVRNDSIRAGPYTIAEKWPGLVKAGFDSIDTILPSPHGNGQTYFFKGMKYARIKVIAGKPDVVEFGPANIMDEWASFDWVKTTKPTDSNSIVRFTEPTEVDPALEVLLGRLEKLSSSALTAQAGIDKNPDDNEKYRADLVAAKKAEGEIEEQIKEQFPDLYAKYHKGSESKIIRGTIWGGTGKLFGDQIAGGIHATTTQYSPTAVRTWSSNLVYSVRQRGKCVSGFLMGAMHISNFTFGRGTFKIG
ncbi:hypothetical protein ACLOAV_001504 [Pseudogymnoascus australis]